MKEKEATEYFNRYARYYDNAPPFYAIRLPGGLSLFDKDVSSLADRFYDAVITKEQSHSGNS